MAGNGQSNRNEKRGGVMPNPIWITVDDGDTFEGHQGQWADCFYACATRAMIEKHGTGFTFPPDQEKVEIREMTLFEVLTYPEALEFRKFLIEVYGEE
jgi:hypothetical protein